MLIVPETFDDTVIFFIVAGLLAILGYVLVVRGRARRARRDTDAVTTAVVEFFRDQGHAVSVRCISEKGGKRFVALMDPVPSMGVAHSHIVARILTAHVRAVCGLELARVHWRFPTTAAPIQTVQEQAPLRRLKPSSDTDDYRPEQRHRLAHAAAYEVVESSWEQFQETAQGKELAC